MVKTERVKGYMWVAISVILATIIDNAYQGQLIYTKWFLLTCRHCRLISNRRVLKWLSVEYSLHLWPTKWSNWWSTMKNGYNCIKVQGQSAQFSTQTRKLHTWITIPGQIGRVACNWKSVISYLTPKIYSKICKKSSFGHGLGYGLT